MREVDLIRGEQGSCTVAAEGGYTCGISMPTKFGLLSDDQVDNVAV